ncbi:MAG: hypothetical protein ACOY3M_01250 [Patescibacteria group bacterium]
MSKESQPTRAYTPAEQGFQRLLIREQKHESQPGDGLRRLGINSSLLIGSTALDLAESHLVDAVIRNPMHDRIHQIKEKGPNFTEQAKRAQGVQFAAEFVEEWASDSIYANMANAWVRAMTGMDDAKYVSETAAFLAEWGNVISQVFLADRLYGKTKTHHGHTVPQTYGKVKLAYASADFLNPVNVEAAIRVMEEVPVIGKAVSWMHDKTDHLLETAAVRLGSGIAGKGILGYHIGRNVKAL